MIVDGGRKIDAHEVNLRVGDRTKSKGFRSREVLFTGAPDLNPDFFAGIKDAFFLQLLVQGQLVVVSTLSRQPS